MSTSADEDPPQRHALSVLLRAVLPSTPVGRRVGTMLSIGTGAVLMAHLLTVVTNGYVRIPEWRAYFDVGREGNLPTWWNATLLIGIAVAAGSAASSEPFLRRKRAWWVIAIASAFLSLDEATMLHERLSEPVLNSGIDILPTTAWVIPGVVLALLGTATLVVFGRALRRRTAVGLAIALAVYGFGALGVEAFGGWIRTTSLDSPWLSVARITLEEGLEMVACVYAIVVILESVHFRRSDEVQATAFETAS